MNNLKLWNKTKISRSTPPTPGYQDLGMVLLFIFLLPYIVSFFFGLQEDKNSEEKEAPAVNYDNLSEETWEEGRLTVYNRTKAGTEKMPMEAYLVRRLAATIPGDYEMEALKAQAVVLRTELIKSYYESLNKPEGNADGILLTESETAVPERELEQKLKTAVGETAGMYLTYDKEPLYAPYFAVSAGATRNGNEVFASQEYPYLKSVACQKDFADPSYMTTVQFDKEAFWLKVKKLYPQANVTENISDLILERDLAEYVTNVKVGNHTIPGEVFRFDFSLKSACFTIEETKNKIKIVTKGVGHGIGFGQCAANNAAKAGSDFIDILCYFFSDAEIEKFE